MSILRLELLTDLPANNNLFVLIESSRAIITNSRVFVGNDSKLLVNEVAHKGNLSTTRNWLLVFKYFFLAIGVFVLLGTLAWLGVVITIVLTVPEQAPRGLDLWAMLAIGIVVTLCSGGWLWLVSKLFRVGMAML